MSEFKIMKPYKTGVTLSGIEYIGNVSEINGKFEGLVTEVPGPNQTSPFVDAAREVFDDEESARRFVDLEWEKRFQK